MGELFQIHQLVIDIHNNISSKDHLLNEIDIFTLFIEHSIKDITINYENNKYRKYLLTILEKSKLAIYKFNNRISESLQITFIELYSFYEIVSNVLNGINVFIKSTEYNWKYNYRINSENEYIVL